MYKYRAFTLVELMVVVGIITIMATIIFASISMARENTREKKRVADLSNIEMALLLFNEKERTYPEYDAGIEIGIGEGIDDAIEMYNGNAYTDPKSQDDAYAYWYDSDFTCYGPGQAVLYARTMEQSKNANYTEVCTHASADTTNGAGNSSYIIVLTR